MPPVHRQQRSFWTSYSATLFWLAQVHCPLLRGFCCPFMAVLVWIFLPRICSWTSRKPYGWGQGCSWAHGHLLSPSQELQRAQPLQSHHLPFPFLPLCSFTENRSCQIMAPSGMDVKPKHLNISCQSAWPFQSACCFMSQFLLDATGNPWKPPLFPWVLLHLLALLVSDSGACPWWVWNPPNRLLWLHAPPSGSTPQTSPAGLSASGGCPEGRQESRAASLSTRVLEQLYSRCGSAFVSILQQWLVEGQRPWAHTWINSIRPWVLYQRRQNTAGHALELGRVWLLNMERVCRYQRAGANLLRLGQKLSGSPRTSGAEVMLMQALDWNVGRTVQVSSPRQNDRWNVGNETNNDSNHEGVQRKFCMESCPKKRLTGLKTNT